MHEHYEHVGFCYCFPWLLVWATGWHGCGCLCMPRAGPCQWVSSPLKVSFPNDWRCWMFHPCQARGEMLMAGCSFHEAVKHLKLTELAPWHNFSLLWRFSVIVCNAASLPSNLSAVTTTLSKYVIFLRSSLFDSLKVAWMLLGHRGKWCLVSVFSAQCPSLSSAITSSLAWSCCSWILHDYLCFCSCVGVLIPWTK